MGFCFFNNVAVAAAHARAAHGAERVLIVDWDVHHGNGTNDIFHADPSVLFCSIHEWPLYPGTGPAGDAGSGAGVGYTVNLPVPAGSGDDVHGSLVEHVVAPLCVAYAPQLVLVSAGFDAHRADPLASLRLSDAVMRAKPASLSRSVASGSARCASKPAETSTSCGFQLTISGATTCSTSDVCTSSPEPPGTGRLSV